MSTQAQLDFNPVKAEAAKVAGMNQAAEERSHILQRAREVAKQIARTRGIPITADDVYRRLIADGYHIANLGPAAGSIFKGDCWKMVGYRKSERVSNHGRDIKLWALNSH